MAAVTFAQAMQAMIVIGASSRDAPEAVAMLDLDPEPLIGTLGE